MNNSRKTILLAVVLIFAMMLLACDLGSTATSSQTGTGSQQPAGGQQQPSGGQQQPSGGQQQPSGGQQQPSGGQQQPSGGQQQPSGGQVAQVPAAPANLRVTSTTKTTARVAWDDKSNNEDGFEIEVPGKQNPKTGANETQWEITNLECGQSYKLRVRASNAAGNSAFGNEVTAQTAACSGGAASVPTAPSNLTMPSWTKDSAKLTWKDNSNNEDGFEIAVTDMQNVKTGPNETQWQVTGLKCGQSYKIKVRAFNAAGSSAFSNELTAQTVACETLGIPAAPSNLTMPSWTKDSAKLTWKDNSNNEDGFEIAVTDMQNVKTGPNETQWQVTGLKCGQSYKIKVRAFNAAGNSAFSNELTAQTVACETLGMLAAPSDLKITSWTKETVRMTWKDNSNNEDGFEIAVEGVQDPKTGPNVTQYEVTNLKCGVNYNFRVRAFNAAGNSGYSNAIPYTRSVCP